MKNSKLLLTLLCTVLAVMLATGCPSNKSGPQGDDSNSYPADDSGSSQDNTNEPVSQQNRVVLVEVFTTDG